MIDLKAFRRANNLTQDALGEYICMKKSFISKIENGKEKLPKDKFQKLIANDRGWDTSMLTYDYTSPKAKNKIPLYDDATIGGNNEMAADVNGQARVTEWIDAGDWFPGATSAIYHYGDSMVEYPSGCILACKRVYDPSVLVNGEHYVIETDEFRITKEVQDDGGDYILAYSSNRETYPDGHLIHSPIRIPKASIRHLDRVLGCVVKRVSNGHIKIAR